MDQGNRKTEEARITPTATRSSLSITRVTEMSSTEHDRPPAHPLRHEYGAEHHIISGRTLSAPSHPSRSDHGCSPRWRGFATRR
jgi:hypothetical protein